MAGLEINLVHATKRNLKQRLPANAYIVIEGIPLKWKFTQVNTSAMQHERKITINWFLLMQNQNILLLNSIYFKL